MSEAKVHEARPFWRSHRSLLYLVALVFFAIVLWRSRFWESGDALSNIDAEYLVLVPLLSLALVVPLSLRGRLLLSALGYHVSAIAVAPIAYYGNTVGFMTPAASGEALRPALFKRVFGLPTPQGIGIVLFERLFSFCLFGLSCLLAFSWTGDLPAWVGPAALPFLVGACFVPGAFVAAAPALNNILPAERLARLLPHRVREHVEESSATLRKLWLNIVLVALFVLLSAATFLLLALQFWLIPYALGQDLSLSEAYVVLTASALAGFLSGLPLGLGATDAVMLSLLRAYGVDATEAGQIVILSRVLINLPGGLFGLAAYLLAIRQPPAAAEIQPSALVAASAGGKSR